jgi:hypothetical protein
MKKFRIIVDDAAAWSPYYPSEQIITAENYLQQSQATEKPGYIINLCSGLEYLLRGKQWRLGDLLSDESYDRSGDEMRDAGLYFELKPWQCHLFRMRAL